ncbi:MAG: choice-of-anchor D domain-containing protein [Deltaproteobacteria bacterium]|nr:choice-of-anchor D domain-containing protein [Deltaproteobacteria bacterium]
MYDPRRRLVGSLVVVSLIIWLGCQDDTLHGNTPKIDHFHHGPSDNPPAIDDFNQIPESSEIVVDFGQVDIQTVNRQYLFIRNEGKGSLIISSFDFLSGSSQDFIVACFDNGVFVANCPYSVDNTLSIGPGRDLVFELTYAPVETGVDVGGFVVTFNTTEHHSLTVHLAGEGITREIEVCITNCIGDQQQTECQQADELCNDAMGKDSLVVSFGETPTNVAASRDIIIRNLGQRTLRVFTLELVAGSGIQYTLDTAGSGLPGELATNEEASLAVSYAPDSGEVHLGRIRIRSDDVSEPEIEIILGGSGVAPRVCPDPLMLDFGNVVVGLPVIKSFNLENCGSLPLDLYGVAMALVPFSPDFSLVDPGSLPASLPAGDIAAVEVQYLPQAAGSDAGGVDIFSNDLVSDPVTHLTGTVALFGRATALVCDLVVDPFAASFGVVEIGAPATVDLVLSNSGNGPCLLASSTISANSPDNEFTIISAPPADASIDPGAGNELTLTVGYDPIDRGQDVGTLSLFVNDKDTNEVRVDLNAFGNWPGGDGPVAVCSVSPVNAIPFQTVTWRGDQSYDTNNRAIVDHRWSIASFPAGSAATLWGFGANRTTEIDLAGSYTAELVVENDIGQVSPPCLATTTVVPTEDLWIEMYWAHNNDDMDLHLLAPGGTPRTNSDCFFSNCIGRWFTPDWGQAGYDGDDPHLDLDDIPGTGPENINIADPANGVYTVFVHDYPGNSYTSGNLVTINVYINGALVANFTETISGENSDWYVCEIDWPSGAVTPL